MSLSSLEAGSELGFVSGVVDEPISPEDRACGRIGHTVDEWIAYNERAGAHPLKNNHGAVVGRVVHTYVDNRNRLCASALIDPAHAALWGEVRSGRVHSFSIGFDATPDHASAAYKNNNFEVSLTDNPLKPNAVIQVRCSKNPMSDTPAPAESTPAPAPMPVDDAAMQQLAEMRRKAELYDAQVKADQERIYAEQRARIEAAKGALKESGMDVDNPGQQAVLDELARTPHAAQLLTAIERLAAARAEETKRAEEAARRAAEEEAKRAAAEAESRRNMSVYDKLRNVLDTPASKRQLTPSAWSATQPAELPTQQSSLLGLNAINPALFQHVVNQMNQAAAAAPPTATTAAAATAQPPATEAPEPTLTMPADPVERMRIASQFAHANQPMPVTVRCSAGAEPAAILALQKAMDDPKIVMHNKQMLGLLTPTDAEVFFGNPAHWAQMSAVIKTGSLPPSSNGFTYPVSRDDGWKKLTVDPYDPGMMMLREALAPPKDSRVH
jgi:hypothetical protein